MKKLYQYKYFICLLKIIDNKLYQQGLKCLYTVYHKIIQLLYYNLQNIEVQNVNKAFVYTSEHL